MEIKLNLLKEYDVYELYRMLGEKEKAAKMALNAGNLKPQDVSLAKMTAQLLYQLGMYEDAYEFCTKICDKSLINLSRIRLYHAASAAKLGKRKEAEAIFYKYDTFEVDDQREGEITITETWLDIEALRAKESGVEFDRAKAKCPEKYNFKMNTMD